MPRPPTLRDIAAESGVSMATASYALRGLRVPAATQLKVRRVAERLGYRANPIARALASGRTASVGVMAGQLTDSWQQFVMAELVASLPSIGRQAVIVDSNGDPDTELAHAQRLAGERLDALVVMAVDPASTTWRDVQDTTRLIALGDALPHADRAHEIVYDNACGICDALNRLAAEGHRKVAVSFTAHPATPNRPVATLARQLADELGLELQIQPAGADLASITERAIECLSSAAAPTAVFCLSDSIAWGVYAAAQQLGLQVGEDISLLGYDGAAVSGVLTPALAGYRWPIDQVVQEVLKAIDAADDAAPGRVSLRPCRIEGASLAPPVLTRSDVER